LNSNPVNLLAEENDARTTAIYEMQYGRSCNMGNSHHS